MPKSDKVWCNGELVDWVCQCSHALSCCSLRFERLWYSLLQYGKRCGCFSSKGARRPIFIRQFTEWNPYSREEICEAILETIRVNGLMPVIFAPLCFADMGRSGLIP